MKIFLCLLTFLLIPAIAFSQTGTIEGTVYNSSTGEPLAGLEVRNYPNRYATGNR